MCGKFVEHKGEKIPMTSWGGKNYLSLRRKGVNDIKDIKGLDQLVELTNLDLTSNNITEICCLEPLVNLETLNLGGNQIREIKGLDTLLKLDNLMLNGNNITKISGMGNLKNLTSFFIYKNPIHEWARDNLGGTNLANANQFLKPQMLVEYCQQKTDSRPFSEASAPKSTLNEMLQESYYSGIINLELLANVMQKPVNKVIRVFYGLTIKGIIKGDVNGTEFKAKFGVTEQMINTITETLQREL